MKSKVFVFFVLLMLGVVLVGCGGNETGEILDDNSNDVDTTEGNDQEDEDMRDGAIEADFVKINSDEVEEGTKLVLEGEVGVVFGTSMFDEFSITSEENDGFGMYDIVNYTGDIEISQGDKVRVWGLYGGKDEDTGIPKINAFAYEIIDE